MKALEYLYRMKQANYEMGYEPENLIEAINELEAMQSRSCESCKHGEVIGDTDKYLYCVKLGDDYPHKDFYCKYYERKEDDTTK